MRAVKSGSIPIYEFSPVAADQSGIYENADDRGGDENLCGEKGGKKTLATCLVGEARQTVKTVIADGLVFVL